MTPSAARAAAITLSGSVVPFFASVFRPAPSDWNSSPSLKTEFAFCSTASVAAVISGPMPSPGRTRMFIAVYDSGNADPEPHASRAGRGASRRVPDVKTRHAILARNPEQLYGFA